MKLNIKNIYAWPLTTRVLIIGLICAIVYYLAYQWDIDSLKSQLTSAESKEADLKEQMELVLNKQAAVRSDLSQFSAYQAMLIEWQKKLVSYDQIPELLNEILKIGANNHIEFALFSPGQITIDGIYHKLPIKVTAVGSYHQLANFISQVANMPWIVVVSDFSFSQETKADVLGSKLVAKAALEHLLTAEFTLLVYHLPEANAHGK